MEKNLMLQNYYQNLGKKNNTKEIKNKILYKFQIIDNNLSHHNYKGKCYFLNLKNNLTSKQFSFSKIKSRPGKLPIINLKDYNLRNINTITLSNSKKTLESKEYKYSENNEIKTTLINSYNVPNHFKEYNNKKEYRNSLSFKELSRILKKEKVKKIMEKMNQRYFLKNSTMKYLTSLFYGNPEMHDLKVVNLSKIKGEKQNYNNYMERNNLKLNNTSKNNSYFGKRTINKRFNYFNEKAFENSIDDYKVKKLNLDEKIKSFHNLKMKKCKMLVNSALKDIIKTKKDNLACIENFRKDCDFKYEDF